jgi:hypothetical protein
VEDSLSHREATKEEQAIAFAIISFSIRIRGQLPLPILRALISLYFANISSFESLILSLLGQAVLLCPNLPFIPEISDVFISDITKNVNQTIIGLFASVMETGHPLVRHPDFISKLLAPLTNLNAAEGSLELILSLLRTWPGFFCLILQHNGGFDLTDGLRTKPKEVLQILKRIFLLDGWNVRLWHRFVDLHFIVFKKRIY